MAVTKDQIRIARTADLYDFLLSHVPERFKKEGNSLRFKESPGVIIRRDFPGYKDFSADTNGNSIDFLTRYLNMSFVEAVEALSGFFDNSFSHQETPKVPPLEKKEIVFPDKSNDRQWNRLFAFLCNERKIPCDIVQNLIDQGLLYEDLKHNIIFANRARTCYELRGTITGRKFCFSDRQKKSDCWFFSVGETPQIAYLCEGAIDAISLFAIHCASGDVKAAYYVSIGSVANRAILDRFKASSLKVILAVDNDDAGQQCREKYPEFTTLVPIAKDWNDELKNHYNNN